MVEKDDTITEIVKFSWNSLFMKFLDIRSNMFKKHSDKKGNFVEESFAAELNVIWIPAHFWNTDSDNAETYLFIFILIYFHLFWFYWTWCIWDMKVNSFSNIHQTFKLMLYLWLHVIHPASFAHNCLNIQSWWDWTGALASFPSTLHPERTEQWQTVN